MRGKVPNVVPLGFYDHFKATVDQTLPIKGHGIYIRLQARILAQSGHP